MPRGSKPGERRGGRSVGTRNAKTLQRTALVAKAVAAGEAPLDVMLANMRHFHKLAESAEAALAELSADKVAEMEPEEQFKHLLAEVKKAAGLRELAQSCARDAASYVHPRLTAISAPDGGPVQIEKIERIIVDAANSNRKDIPAAS